MSKKVPPVPRGPQPIGSYSVAAEAAGLGGHRVGADRPGAAGDRGNLLGHGLSWL